MKSQIFVAAGGKGSRLGDITLDTPKSMVVINGLPIIDHIVDSARQADIDQIVVGVDEGKETLVDHVISPGVEIEYDCVEPLTSAFFRSIRTRSPDFAIGVNGDTIYRPETIERAIKTLTQNSEIAASLLLTNVVRPIFTSSWIYWHHIINDGLLVAMDEVAGHEIDTEYVMAVFRSDAIKELSHDFSLELRNDEALPFRCYSWGWDYILRLMIWRGFKVAGIVGDDLSLNINCPNDLTEGELFFTDPGRFRYSRMTPCGTKEPLQMETSLVVIKPVAVQSGLLPILRAFLDDFGLKVIDEKTCCVSKSMAQEWYQEQQGMPWFAESVELLSSGESHVLLVSGKGAFYKALCWKKEMRKRFAITPTNNMVHATFSRSSFSAELRRELVILGLNL